MNGWAAVTALVAGYDAWAICTRRPTMSAACRSWQSTPRRRLVVLAACLAMTRHLVRRTA